MYFATTTSTGRSLNLSIHEQSSAFLSTLDQARVIAAGCVRVGVLGGGGYRGYLVLEELLILTSGE